MLIVLHNITKISLVGVYHCLIPKVQSRTPIFSSPLFEKVTKLFCPPICHYLACARLEGHKPKRNDTNSYEVLCNSMIKPLSLITLLTLNVPEKLQLYGLHVYYVVHICDFGMLRVNQGPQTAGAYLPRGGGGQDNGPPSKAVCRSTGEGKTFHSSKIGVSTAQTRHFFHGCMLMSKRTLFF